MKNKKLLQMLSLGIIAVSFTACTSTEPTETTEVNNTETTELTEQVAPTQAEDPAANHPKYADFQEKQQKMGELFQEFSANNPEVQAIQEEMNTLFADGEFTEEKQAKANELGEKMQSLFTGEMKQLDAELRELGNEIYGAPAVPAGEEGEAAPAGENGEAAPMETEETAE